MFPSRHQVELSIESALRVHGLDEYTDGVMDSLDAAIEWAESFDE